MRKRFHALSLSTVATIYFAPVLHVIPVAMSGGTKAIFLHAVWKPTHLNALGSSAWHLLWQNVLILTITTNNQIVKQWSFYRRIWIFGYVFDLDNVCNMSTKQGDKCRFCFTSGFFHINLFSTSQKAVQAISEIFHCEVISIAKHSVQNIKSFLEFIFFFVKGRWVWWASEFYLCRLLDDHK